MQRIRKGQHYHAIASLSMKRINIQKIINKLFLSRYMLDFSLGLEFKYSSHLKQGMLLLNITYEVKID
jgi:hypothetical protein